MGMLRYIKMTFKDDIKKSRFYMLILTFSVVVIFNIFNISFNKEILSARSSEYLSVSALAFVVMGVSIMFILFANSYYMEEKFKEYAVMSISGNSIKTICKVIMIRNTIVAVISVALGCLIGVILSFPIIKGAYVLLNITAGTGVIAKYSILTTVILMITEMEMVFVINTGKVYGSTINELFHRDRTAYIPDKRKHRVYPAIYIFLYIFPLLCGVIPMTMHDRILMIRYAATVGLVGIWGVVRYVIPEIMKKRRAKEMINDKCRLIQSANIYSSIQNSASVIIVLVAAILISIMVGSGYKTGSLVSTMSLVCYGMIILIMSLTVVYKFVIEARARRNNFTQLKLLGYIKSDIKQIIINEVKTYYLMLILLALPLVFIITLSSVLEGLMTISTEIIILIAFVAVFSLTGIVAYKLYAKSVI